MSDRSTPVALGRYFRRLLTPPLPGDGLLLVGFVEGVAGWSLSWLLVTTPSLAPFGPVGSVVALWAALTVGILVIGVVYTAPTVRRNRVWLVWGGLNTAVITLNVLTLAGVVPPTLRAYTYWHPWLAVFGVGYLVTAINDIESPQIRRRERLAYGVGGVASLAVLAVSVAAPPPALLANPFLVGSVLHLVPIGYDVFADASLLLRG